MRIIVYIMLTTITNRFAASLTLVASLLVAPLPVCAQAAQRNANFLKNSFDDQVERLPPNFRGHSFDEVFSPLWSSVSKIKEKSDYETEVQAENRVRSDFESIERRLASKYGVGNTRLAFVINPEIEYLAESEQFSKNIYAQNYSSTSQFVPFSWSVRYSTRINQLGKYYVRNFFGQPFEIIKTDELYKEIVIRPCLLKNGKPFTVELPSLGKLEWRVISDLAVDVPPQKAERIHSNIRWLLVVENLIAPYANLNKFTSGPSIEYRPYSHSINEYRVLTLQLNSLWIFDVKTGEVLKKLPSCSVKSSILNTHNRFVHDSLEVVETYLF